MVAEYYEGNTRRFLRLGGSGEAAAIHRQIWAPGVRTNREAFEYVNARVEAGLQPAAGSRLLDLGCGVGGTATWLAQRLPVQVQGVTLSPLQARLAAERAAALGLPDRCTFSVADFEQLAGNPGFEAGSFTGAYAIEAFAHAASPGRFFEQAAALLARGGRLVICDDFRAAQIPAAEQTRAEGWLRRFEAGWRLSRLESAAAAITAAQAAGLRLVDSQKLSSWIRLPPPLLLWLKAALTRLPLAGTYWGNLSGGTALQVCLRRGWSEYWVLVFEK